MNGPVSFFTSNLLTLTEFALSPKEGDSKVVSFLKKGTIIAASSLDQLVRLIETFVSFLFRKAKEISNSEKFQNGKRVVVDYATKAKDFVVEQANRFYQTISALQRPPAVIQPN